MAKFVPLITALLVLGGFILATVLGGVYFQAQNDAPINLTDDPALNAFYQNMNATLFNASSETSTASGAFDNSSIQTGTLGSPFVSALGGIWKVMKTSPIATYNLVATLVFGKLFGDAAVLVFTSIIATIISLMIISAVIYWVSRGEGG